MQQVRHQLTLFVQPQDATAIEAIRSVYNPVQQQLIASHVTLCREDELIPLDVIVAHENTAFHQLRAAVLQPIIATPRLHEPHLTLMHPRNATCTDAIFEVIQAAKLPQQLTFTSITLIQQYNGGKWQALQQYQL